MQTDLRHERRRQTRILLEVRNRRGIWYRSQKSFSRNAHLHHQTATIPNHDTVPRHASTRRQNRKLNPALNRDLDLNPLPNLNLDLYRTLALGIGRGSAALGDRICFWHQAGHGAMKTSKITRRIKSRKRIKSKIKIRSTIPWTPFRTSSILNG